MKKYFTLILVLVLSFAPFMLAGCSHKHNFGEWYVTKSATCTSEGEKSKKCECGHIETQTLNKTGHNFIAGICSECGEEE